MATTPPTLLRFTPGFQRNLFNSSITLFNKHNFGTKRRKKQPNIKKIKNVSPPPPRPKDTQAIPPAYLHPTASPHVWIAGCAAQELNIDPKKIFTEAFLSRTAAPTSFSYSQFQYVPSITIKNTHIPEVAFLGRSNVGKSSLINALTGKKRKLARVSKTPGRTQQVNYFALLPQNQNDPKPAGYLVDLPGYGYAKAPDKIVSSWQKMTLDFVLDRRDVNTLKRLYLLIDSRTGMLLLDHEVMRWFDEAGIRYSILLTKSDRVRKSQVVRIVNEVCMRYHSQMYGVKNGFQGPMVHVTSSKDRSGISELMWSIDGDFTDVEGRGGGGEGWR